MAKKIEDRRIRRTRQTLQDALIELIPEKGYDAITVQDVLDRADVGRSTFYAHFQDKDDLLLSGFEHLKTLFENHLMNVSASSDDPWSLGLSMFQHAQEQRQLYKALAGKQGGNIALTHIQKYLYTSLHDHLKAPLSKKKKGVPPEILAHYISSSFIALLTWWLDTDSKYSTEQMNNYFIQLVQPGIEKMM